jgi:hypothetical protein
LAAPSYFDETTRWQFTLDVYLDEQDAVVARVSDARISLGRGNDVRRMETVADLLSKAADDMRAEATALQHSLKTTGKAPDAAIKAPEAVK